MKPIPIREFIWEFLGSLAVAIVALAIAVPDARAQVPIYTRGPSSSTSSVLPSAFPLLAPDGSTSAPSYSFINNTNLGIWRNGGGSMAFAAAAIDVFQANGTGITLNPATALQWSSSGVTAPDTALTRDAADTLAQRRSTNAQTFRLYNTFTDASNYERGSLGWVGNILTLQTEAAGTGSARAIKIGGAGIFFDTPAGTSKWQISNSTGHLVGSTDNTVDIGAAGSNRPRSGFFATSLVSPLFRSDSAKVLVQGTGTGASQLAVTQTTAPTCSSNCGTSPSVAGSDSAMIVTMGASGVPASGWVVTFNGTWAAAPACIVQMALAGMVVGKQPLTAVTTTTTLTVVTNGTAPANSDKYAIQCMGVQ